MAYKYCKIGRYDCGCPLSAELGKNLSVLLTMWLWNTVVPSSVWLSLAEEQEEIDRDIHLHPLWSTGSLFKFHNLEQISRRTSSRQYHQLDKDAFSTYSAVTLWSFSTIYFIYLPAHHRLLEILSLQICINSFSSRILINGCHSIVWQKDTC